MSKIKANFSYTNNITEDYGIYDDGSFWSMDEIREDFINNREDYQIDVLDVGLVYIISTAKSLGITGNHPNDFTSWFYSKDPDLDGYTYSLHIEGITKATFKRINRLLNK